MADGKSSDWKNKASEIAQKSKTAATKGLQSAKKNTKTLVVEGKNAAEKGIEKTQKTVQRAVESTESFVISQMDKKHSAKKESMKKSSFSTSNDEVIEDLSELNDKKHKDNEKKIVDYSKFTVVELKTQLRMLKLSLSGKKAELVERLQKAKSQPSKDKPKKDKLIKDKPIKDIFIGTKLESIIEHSNEVQPMKHGDLEELGDIYERIKEIEVENPEVLKPLKPKNQTYNSKSTFSNILFYLTGLSVMLYSILLILPSINKNTQIKIISEYLELIEKVLPSWFLPHQMQPLPVEMHIPFVLTGSFIIFCSGILLVSKNKKGSNFIISFFFGFLIIGRLLSFHFSDIAFTSEISQSVLRDLVIAMIVSCISLLPTLYNPARHLQPERTIFDTSGLFVESAKKQYTSDNVGRIIEEGFNMDFRTEVARPKHPSARAKFESYELLLLLLALIMWPITLFVTAAYNSGLSGLTNFAPNDQILIATWSISLFILLCLIRFDKSARNNGMYSKEKETYGSLMDLYNKAQTAHYEYVELRAAAEAQQIIEKYPQLGTAKINPSIAES